MGRFEAGFLDAYYREFPVLTEWQDLLQKSKIEAENSGADFMSLSPSEASLMVQAIGLAQATEGESRWIEVGSLTGFSALCLLMALGKRGRVWALEKDPRRAAFMRQLFEDPRLGGRLCVVEGDSRQTKKTLETEGPFDGIFIDGAKAEYLNDLAWAEQNIRSGGLVLADNVFLSGATFPNWPPDERSGRFSERQAQTMHAFLQKLADPSRYRTLLLPTSDGLAVARKLF